jgi:hypothetical protein
MEMQNEELHRAQTAQRPPRDHIVQVLESTTGFRDITRRQQVEDALRFLVRCGTSGEDFFQALARYLARILGMDFVCIDRLQEGLLTAQTVAVYSDGRFEDNVSYALKDTPCGDAVGKEICCVPRQVRHRYPNDQVLQVLRAKSYVGTTLWSSDDQDCIPFAASVGFSREFLEHERSLCLATQDCACIRALNGKSQPSSLRKPDRRVSFFCNTTTRFVKQIAAPRQACSKVACVQAGFESIAIVAIQFQEQVLGAIHLADRPEGRFILLGAQLEVRRLEAGGTLVSCRLPAGGANGRLQT